MGNLDYSENPLLLGHGMPCPFRSSQVRKVLLGLRKLRITLPNNLRRSTLERFLRRYTIKPPLLGKFLMRRKIQPHQQRHVASVRNGLSVVLGFVVLAFGRPGLRFSHRLRLVRMFFLGGLCFTLLLVRFLTKQRGSLAFELLAAIELVL